MYTAIYLSLTLLMSGVMKEQAEEEFTGISLEIALENRDQGELGAALEEYLGESHKIKEIPEGTEALKDAIYYGEIDYVLVIPEDFSEKFAAGDRECLLDGTAVPGSSSSYLAEYDMESFLKTADMYLSAGFEMKDAGDFAMEDMKEKGKVEFLNQEKGPSFSRGYYFFHFIPYVFVTMMILGVGVVIKTFQNKDLSARNKCSAVPYLQQSLQILLGCLVYIDNRQIRFIYRSCLGKTAHLLNFLIGNHIPVRRHESGNFPGGFPHHIQRDKHPAQETEPQAKYIAHGIQHCRIVGKLNCKPGHAQGADCKQQRINGA